MLFKLFIFCTILISTVSGGYVWVLPSGHIMTSTCGEFRVGHFHGGIDLRASVGHPIVAPADGWVQKVAVSPWGYGKVLYFVFSDTLTAIFGHLSRFAEPVQSKVVKKQYEQKKFITEIWFKKNEISYSAGDTIAFSGKTGVGKPHLHFEIRKQGDTIIAPQLVGFTPPDTLPPVIQSVALIPMSQNGFIEEGLMPLLIRPGDDFSKFQRPVRFWGKMAAAIAFYDHTDEANPNRMGVRKLQLFLDDSLIFFCDYDSFYYGETANEGFVYDGGLEYRFGMRFHKLFVPGSLKITQFLKDSPNAGVMDAQEMLPQKHILKWRLEDFSQNVAQGSVAVVPSPVDEVPMQFVYDDNRKLFVEVSGDPKDIAVQFCPNGDSVFTTIAEDKKKIPVGNRRGFFRPIGLQNRQIYPFIMGTGEDEQYHSQQCSLFVLEDFLYYISKLDVAPRCVPEFAIAGMSIEYQMLHPDLWLLRHSTKELLDKEFPFVEIFIGDPEFPYAKLGEFSPVMCLLGYSTISKFSSSKWNATLSIPDDALIQPAVFYNWFEPVNGHNVASMLFHFLPSWQYFKIPASISFKPTAENSLSDDTLKKLCIVRWWNGNWYYIPTEHRGKILISKVRALGDFALMWDNEPPKIELDSVSADTIIVKIKDNLSGFGGGNLPTAMLDDKWVLSEYDPEDKTLFVLPRKPLDKGKHLLKLQTIDRAGNSAEREFEIAIK